MEQEIDIMKAEELMVGDWIQIVPDAPIMPNECHRVDWIRTGEIGLDNRRIVTYPYIQPIPLTPEILEKNGFEKQGFEGWEIDHKTDDGNDLEWLALWRNDYSSPHLRINSFMSLYGSFSSFEIRYVHELQHALRLCGIEKEIGL